MSADAYYDDLEQQEWEAGDPWFASLAPHRARGGAMRGAGFVPGLRSIAQDYNRRAGLPRIQEHILHPLDPDFSRRTALAYEALPRGSSAADRRAYRAFAEETGAQYEHLKRAGFTFEGTLDDPYSAPGRLTKMQQAAQDVRKNKRLLAFGSALEHPLLSNEENLMFRHVHDMMGHLTEGFSIGPRGEYNAAVKHSQMYSPLARQAMLAETHGQNSVVNFSPTIHPAFGRSIADVNRERPGSIYADQKSRALPDEIMAEFYARTGIHRYRGGPALSSVFPGGVDLSAYPRRDRLTAGKELYRLGSKYPYAASRTSVRAITDEEMRQANPYANVLELAGVTDMDPRVGRPIISLNASMSDRHIARLQPGSLANDLKGLVGHEFGHAVDFANGVVSQKRPYRGTLKFAKPVSPYGQMGGGFEHFAELFLQNEQGFGANPDLFNRIQQLDLERMNKKPRWRNPFKAKGGDVGKGLYIVNELGRETFVPKSHEHLIPPEVAAEIPGADRLSHKQWLAQEYEKWRMVAGGSPPLARKLGGPVEIPGVGPKMWQAPEDGWIIPNRLKNKIKRAAAGDEVDMSSGSGFGPAFEAVSRRRRLGRDYTAEFERRLEETLRARAAIVQARAVRNQIYSALPQGQGPEVTDQGIINARISQGANRGLTGRAALGGAAAFFLGGGEQRRRALAEAQATSREYTRLAPERGRDTLEALNEQIIHLENTSANLRKELTLVDRSTESGRKNFIRLNRQLKETEAATGGVAERVELAGQLRQREAAALAKAQGGAAQNFAAVTAAGFAFNIGMTAVNDALQLGAKATAPMIDQLSGFASTSQRVTKGLADQLPQAGTLSTLFARTGVGAGLSSGATGFLQQVLGPSVTAKAGANAAGQASDLFRAALGNRAPSGLIGGYGGLFGTGLLGSELGGGKGFAEQIAEDVAAARGQNTGGFLGDIFGTAGRGLNALGRGITGGDMSRETIPISQEQLKVSRELLDNFNEAVGRGRTSQGLSAGATLVDVGIGSNDAARVLQIQGIDDQTKKLAQAGVVFKDVSGNVLTSLTDINKAYANASLGFTLPDAQTFAVGQAQQLRAGEQQAAARGAHQRGVEIPGQLGQQIVAQPFMDVMTGISDATQVTITDLNKTADLQKQITAEALAGIEAQAQAIEQNVGPAQASQFRNYMTQVGQAGQEIADINAALANRQAALGRLQYLNQIRLIDRSIGDTKGFLGRAGGSRVGTLERRQFDLSRESQQLGFAATKLSRAADSLSLQLNQRQINFQTAIAGFQAPGITGEERAARIAEAKLEAEYAQRQQNIAVQQYGIGGQQLGIAQQQFGIEGTLAMEQAKRQLEDLERQRAIAVEQHAVEQEQIAAQKRIAALTVTQSQFQAKAQSLFAEATNNFDARLSAAAQYAGIFGGTMAGAIDAVRRAIIRLNEINAPRQAGDERPTNTGPGHAVGGAFITQGPTTALYGEAGTEAGIFIRNPRPFNPQTAFGGGGGGSLTLIVDVHDNTFKGEADEDRLVQKVASATKEMISREASLLGIAS